ncbi:hypothetical protein VWM66_10610, partial [Campylobacter jejuni]
EGGQVSVDLKMQTSVAGLFAAGDLRKDAPKQVICAAGDGAVAAIYPLCLNLIQKTIKVEN